MAPSSHCHEQFHIGGIKESHIDLNPKKEIKAEKKKKKLEKQQQGFYSQFVKS
jgi:hypothetical protein